MHLEISLEFFLMSYIYICICICTCICSILRLCWPTGDSWWEHLGGQGGAAGRSLRPTRQNQNHGGWMGEGDNMDKSIKSPNKPQSGLFELIWVNILLFKRYVVWTSFAIVSLFHCSREFFVQEWPAWSWSIVAHRVIQSQRSDLSKFILNQPWCWSWETLDMA